MILGQFGVKFGPHRVILGQIWVDFGTILSRFNHHMGGGLEALLEARSLASLAFACSRLLSRVSLAFADFRLMALAFASFRLLSLALVSFAFACFRLLSHAGVYFSLLSPAFAVFRLLSLAFARFRSLSLAIARLRPLPLTVVCFR